MATSERPLVAAMEGGSRDKLYLNKGSDEELVCVGYRSSVVRRAGFWSLVVLSLGLLRLVCHWRPVWRLKLTHRRSSWHLAEAVLIKDTFGTETVEVIVIRVIEESPLVARSYSACTLSVSKGSGGEFTYLETDQVGLGSHEASDTTTLTVRPRLLLRYFDHHHVRFMWDAELQQFRRLYGLDDGITCAHIHDSCTGLTDSQVAHRLHLYGPNSIDVEVKSYFKLFFEEVLNPFYIFQVFSVILWSLDDYYIYASCIVLISALSLGFELYETHKQSVTLHEMVAGVQSIVTVIRKDGETLEMPAQDLVPGEMILLPSGGCLMTCDALLISGNAIVNESMLTGESVPVTKTPLAQSEADEIYSPETHKRHTIFAGTQVIQTRYYGDAKVKAVIVRTGFSTAKGELMRSILFPKPLGFQFYQDSMKFVGFLAVMAACGMVYSITLLLHYKEPVTKVVLRALDIVTIVVPPALPAAMTVGTAYAQRRLKKQNIFCISPPRINIAGKIKLVCFDKTGTLTEDGMDLMGVVPTENNVFQTLLHHATDLPTRGAFSTAMATCHSLTIIDGELTGDPLDLKMFNSINYVIEEPGRDTSKFDSLMPTVVKAISRDTYGSKTPTSMPQYEVGIVRQFPFASGLQRMSVIVRVLGSDHMDLYCKGAPEKVVSLCSTDSVPTNFYDELHKYTMRGYRVIAAAWRPLETRLTWPQAQRVPRESVERDLQFCGLLIMENMLKPQTTPVIRQLSTAAIRTVMVTGDNILTAISVARQCEMIGAGDSVVMVTAHPPQDERPATVQWERASHVSTTSGTMDTLSVAEEQPHQHSLNLSKEDSEPIQPQGDFSAVTIPDAAETQCCHLAVTGKSFAVLRQHFPTLMEKILVQGTVFARMSPDQKSQLVEGLQELGYCVGMCGDGANDCGALRAAHAGISLSDAEASVASPFTSRTPNIECVPTLIREGRAALVTSFGLFKYMALYSIIQFVSVLILYTEKTNFSDYQFLYIDLVITTTVAFLMGHTAAYPHLVAKRPPGSLVGPSNIMSILLHVLLVCCFQLSAFFYLTSQSWYEPIKHNDVDRVDTMETTVIFATSCFQYLMLAFAFSKGPPYRKTIWTNVPFLVALIILTILCLWLFLYPGTFMISILQFVEIDDWRFRLTLLGVIGCNFCLVILLESFVVPSRAFHTCGNRLRRKKIPKNRFKVVQAELAQQSQWPPVGTVTMATNSSAGSSHVAVLH